MEIKTTAFYRPHGYGIRHNKEYQYLEGAVATRHGYVRVYSEPTITSCQAIIGGREFYFSASRGYTARGLVTLAVRFAEECAAMGASHDR